MKVVHEEIINALSVPSGTANRSQSTTAYTGSTHQFYAVPVPVRRQIIKQCIKQYSPCSDSEWRILADRLFYGTSHEEKTMGALVLQYRPTVRKLVTFTQLRRWLLQLEGWAEIDVLCYNIYTADELLSAWSAWETFLRSLAKSRHRTLRRSALVFLCGPVSQSPDLRLHYLALDLVCEVAHESEGLITKAVSWLLRSQADTQKSMVTRFIDEHASRLPKIAVRETKRKLKTGKKNR